MVDAESRPLPDDLGAMAFVQSSSLFGSLPPELLGPLIDAGEVFEAPAGTAVVVEGGTDRDLFMIAEGRLEARKAAGDNQVVLGALERPSIFGELGALTAQPRHASVVAVTDCRLIRFPGPLVQSTSDAAPKFGRKLAMLMAARAKESESKVGG